MLFNTIDFIVFLPIVIALYYLIPAKFRWVLLLAASYYFYMSWKAEYLFLIIFSTIIDYFCGLQMDKKPDKKSKRPYLILSLITNLGLLFFFKYYNFAAETLQPLTEKMGTGFHIPHMDFLLPVGISFYTFQTLSYSIDVYNGRQSAEKHLGYFALYVSFFPQLVAGPIERFSRLTPQLKAHHRFTYDNFANGLRLILFGLFIKMVIADNLSGVVDQIYEHPEQYSSLNIFLGMLLYSFQIYSDFYGYSIIAIGSARIMGIGLMDNFKTPYLSKNISEFWQRWHISLSTWFRDYLYHPLGGNRVSKNRWTFNIIVVFIVSGIWHGANWTFIIWGALYGLVYLIEKIFQRLLPISQDASPFSATHIALAIKTFLLVTFIWVFFRSQSFEEAMAMFRYLFANGTQGVASLALPIAIWIMLALFIVSDIILYNKNFDSWIGSRHPVIRWSVYSILLFSILVLAGIDDNPFIYFQF